MNSFEAERKKWNKVYEETDPEQLPWFGQSLPSEVEAYLSQLDKDDPLLVTGCGAGDVVQELSARGFSQALGTDISASAVERAKRRFPGVAFEAVATEEIPRRVEYRNVNALDWLNLHQVSPVEDYLGALGAVSKALCIVWIRDSEERASGKSYVHDGHVHYHDPASVRQLLEQKGLRFVKDFAFGFESNPNAKAARKHSAIGQIYQR